MKRVNLTKWLLKPTAQSSVHIPKAINFPKNGLEVNIPGDNYMHLIDAGLIDDPFYSDNESRLGWIAQCDWEYSTEIDIVKASQFDTLVFDGLDTVADIYVNEKKISYSENMFVKYTIPVNKYLLPGKNSLKVIFHSPLKMGIEKKTQIRQLPSARHKDRAFIRKAQYSFGWDWGPAFPATGIWKEVYIEKSRIEIDHIGFETLSIKGSKAHVKTSLFFKNSSPEKFAIHVRLFNKDQQYEQSFLSDGKEEISYQLEIDNARLWWPHDMGEPQLYELEITIKNREKEEIYRYNKMVGIRTVELKLQENGQNCFKFFINNKALFLKGANWIPADSFLPRVINDKYENLLLAAREANMNVLRVWGGGIYENDIFYETCDRQGILVWQDFLFACATYPDDKKFLANVKEEISQNVQRLKHHPSIIIWCGNNENEWIWFRDDLGPVKNMQGFEFFHTILPEWLKELDTTRPYWPSSPFGDEEDPNSEQSGNRHAWDMWSQWVDYTEVKNDKSLFVTEFGFQAPANIDTFNKAIPKKDRWIQSKVFEHHNKQDEGPERLIKFLASHLPVNTNWRGYIYLTQLNQGFALKTCLEHWRTNGITMGSIIWQLNDCWPVSSWSVIDSESTPKLSYYFVKNIFSQQIIHFSAVDEKVNIELQNQSYAKFSGQYEIYIIETSSGKIKEKFNSDVSINENAAKNIKSFTVDSLNNDDTLMLARLYNHQGDLINSDYYNSCPWKYYKLAKPKISFKKEKNQIILKSERPAYFVDLYAKDVLFSKRGFSILPGEEVKIDVQTKKGNKLKEDDIKIYSLNKYLK